MMWADEDETTVIGSGKTFVVRHLISGQADMLWWDGKGFSEDHTKALLYDEVGARIAADGLKVTYPMDNYVFDVIADHMVETIIDAAKMAASVKSVPSPTSGDGEEDDSRPAPAKPVEFRVGQWPRTEVEDVTDTKYGTASMFNAFGLAEDGDGWHTSIQWPIKWDDGEWAIIDDYHQHSGWDESLPDPEDIERGIVCIHWRIIGSTKGVGRAYALMKP